MKQIILLLLISLFLPNIVFSAEDTILSVFDEGQNLIKTMDNEELQMWESIDRDVALQHRKLMEFREIRRKLNRIALLEKLKNDRTDLDLGHPLFWESSSNNDEMLTNSNEDFGALYKKWIQIRDNYRAYLYETKIAKKRNKLYKDHREKFRKFEEKYDQMLMALQSRMDVVLIK